MRHPEERTPDQTGQNQIEASSIVQRLICEGADYAGDSRTFPRSSLVSEL